MGIELKLNVDQTSRVYIDWTATFPTYNQGLEILCQIKEVLYPNSTRKPDPTCIEETGCAGCNETGLDHGVCEKCSPGTTTKTVIKSTKLVVDTPEIKNPAPKKAKKSPHSKHGDLQLPFIFKENKKGYQAAWSLCRRFNFVPYPEALKLKEAADAKRAAKIKKPCSPAHQRVHEAVKNATPASAMGERVWCDYHDTSEV